ncbi:MAG: hypothetical protein ACI9MC_001286 [Kiritimatiellia bacterium]|jgi:hypothetical protein
MLRHLSFAIVALLATAACTETGVSKFRAPTPSGPQIEVTPPRIEFGQATSTEEVVREFIIKNVGVAPLHIDDMPMLGSAESFTILDWEGPFRLEPDDWITMNVAFRPVRANDVIAYVEIESNDRIDPVIEVDLLGFGSVPRLEIDPPEIDYGDTWIGCAEERTLTLSNAGNEDLVITDFIYDGNLSLGIVPASHDALPITLPPSATTQLRVQFEPLDEQNYVGGLQVESNDPRGIVEAAQDGVGVYKDVVVESFEMPVAPPVDILFAVDQSCSMEDDATRLGNNFKSFVAKINSVTTGWRVGVATRDNGCFRDGFLTPATRNYQSKFSSAVLAWDGGSYTESLLTVVRNSMRESKGGCNAGFVRPDANLHIIMVSDEPEQSRSAWNTLVNEIRGLHPSGSSHVKLSAVAGPYPSGCGTAQAGNGYYQAVNATGGEFLSICDTDWARHIDKLAKASIEGLGKFDLSSTPDTRTLQVFVNSTLWTTGWHMDGNTLVFDDTPPEGATITVQYGELACQ